MQIILKDILAYQSIQLSYHQEKVEWLATLNQIISHLDVVIFVLSLFF